MIVLENVKKSYGAQTVINGLSMQIAPGEHLGIVAPSGSGKTTLLRLIAGLEKPDGGTVETGGRCVYLFQEPRLLPAFTVLENVAAVIDENADARAKKLLTLFGMGEHLGKYPNELSGGMAQRTVLARAFALGGEIYLFDEPFKGLDEESKKALFPLLKDFLKEKTFLLVTHDCADAEVLCEKTVAFGYHMETV